MFVLIVASSWSKALNVAIIVPKIYFFLLFRILLLKNSFFFFWEYFFRDHPFLDSSAGDFPSSSENFYSSSEDSPSSKDFSSSGDFFLLLLKILLLLKTSLLLLRTSLLLRIIIRMAQKNSKTRMQDCYKQTVSTKYLSSVISNLIKSSRSLWLLIISIILLLF